MRYYKGGMKTKLEMWGGWLRKKKSANPCLTHNESIKNHINGWPLLQCIHFCSLCAFWISKKKLQIVSQIDCTKNVLTGLWSHTLRKELWNPFLLQSHMTLVYLQRNVVDNNKVNSLTDMASTQWHSQIQWLCNYNGTPSLCPDKGS